MAGEGAAAAVYGGDAAVGCNAAVYGCGAVVCGCFAQLFVWSHMEPALGYACMRFLRNADANGGGADLVSSIEMQIAPALVANPHAPMICAVLRQRRVIMPWLSGDAKYCARVECYVVRGTEFGYGYAGSGTELATAMRAPVLS
eukprot:2938405-Rhodomonas_salina.2